jgi:hypothetical protein
MQLISSLPLVPLTPSIYSLYPICKTVNAPIAEFRNFSPQDLIEQLLKNFVRIWK